MTDQWGKVPVGRWPLKDKAIVYCDWAIGLVIEFEHGEIQLAEGQMTTIPRGLRHRTRAGGELEQIQFLLGHVSVQTTEKYLGCKQRLREAVNDKIGIEPGP